MRITFAAGQSFVQLAFISFALFPKLISTQQASDARVYASTVIQSKQIYIISGSDSTLEVPILNFANGIDVNKAEWLKRQRGPELASLKPFQRGVIFQGAGNQVFIQGGNGTSKEMQNLMRYSPATDSYDDPYQEATFARPPASYMMSASIDSATNIAYYFGGQPLEPLGASASADFTSFDTTNHKWTKLSPQYPNAHRPGRIAHSSNIINNQMFIFGGVTDDANSTTDRVEADFNSVLVYDINSNTAASVTTLGDIPPKKQSYSTALGIDGRSIVMYGGYVYDSTGAFNGAADDVYVLDTCTLTWRKQSVSGTSPGVLYGHNAVNINNYMVLLMGKTNDIDYNERVYILDMSNWKWISSFDAKSIDDSIATSTCQFELPPINSTNFNPFTYDNSVLENPLRPAPKNVKSTGFGVGFGLFALVLIVGGVWYYMRRQRKKSRTMNPRWMRNVPSHTNDSHGNAYGDDRDYPLFVYNKELDKDNANSPNYNKQNAFAPHGVRTYTASDHEQWENQLNEEAENPRNEQSMNRHSDIWKRMRGLNDASVISDEEVRTQARQNDNKPSNGKLLDL